jgi:2-polyprenyl-3-methyl-5-hydroxy-6-metoxy-1,4-benzoquinol methylase
MTTSSTDASYAERLRTKEAVWWKRLVDVQLPYRLHLQRLKLGFVLDVGCGLGRNLTNLGGSGVGVDPNVDAVAICRQRGLVVFTPDELAVSEYAKPERFDTLLISHVLEHLSGDDAAALVARHTGHVKRGGRVVLITPQEAGYRSDPTHVEFVDLVRLDALVRSVGLAPHASYSFPFPRPVGRWFKYNEFVLIARTP